MSKTFSKVSPNSLHRIRFERTTTEEYRLDLMVHHGFYETEHLIRNPLFEI